VFIAAKVGGGPLMNCQGTNVIEADLARFGGIAHAGFRRAKKVKKLQSLLTST
jgi:hypothetical protein